MPAQKCGSVVSPRGGYPPPHGPVAQRIERRTSNPCAEVRLLPGPSFGTDGTSAAAHKPLPRDGRARSSRLVQVRGPATLQGGSRRGVKARRRLSQIVAKLTSPPAEATQSTGAVRPQRGQTHSVTGSPRDPLRPGCACCPAQRVRSRIGPWPRGQALGSTVSSGGSAKAAPSYGTPPPMCFGQDLLP